MRRSSRFVKEFLKSSEATASGFSCVGWDIEHQDGDDIFAAWVDYGILSEMELDVVVEKDEGWFMQMYIPPVLAKEEGFARTLCEQFPSCGLVAAMDDERAVVVGATGKGDIEQRLPTLWRAFDLPDVYERILVLCGLSEAPPQEEAEYEEDEMIFDTQEET